MKKHLPFLLYILLCYPILQEGRYFNTTITILNIILSLICFGSLFLYRGNKYSLFKMFHLFMLFFFCIAPSIQYRDGVKFMGTYFNEGDYILTTSVSICIVLLYNLLYNICYRAKLKVRTTTSFQFKKLGFKQEILLLCISISICSYYLYLNNFNIFSLLFRGGEFVERVNTSQMVGLVSDNFLRPMVVFIFLAAYLIKIKHKIILLLLLSLMLLTASPSGMPRFSAAALYLPLVLCVFPFLRKQDNFIYLIIVGLLLVFPFLDVFRYLNSDYSFSSYEVNFDQFKDLHFDSYSMFMRVLKDDVVTLGYQLLGVLLFFIPRSLWPAKPTGSGHALFESLNMHFTNVSMPLWGEGYINFGFIGVIAFVVFVAIVTARMDKQYWFVSKGNIMNFNSALYLSSLGLFFFILRGDLMSSFAYSCGFAFSYCFIYKLLQKL